MDSGKIKITPSRMSRLGRILTIFCLLVLMVKTKGEVVEVLGLAGNAFDDQYVGCREDMENHLKAEDVLEAEMVANADFRRAWKEGEKIWQMKLMSLGRADLPNGFGDLHGIALVTYTGFIRDMFNEAVKSAGSSYGAYKDDFHYKFLHYYVTAALQLLHKESRKNHRTTYRGFDDVLLHLPQGTSKVKFGHFLHMRSNEALGYELGNTSYLTVTGCRGVPIHKFSQYPLEEEVIFPGYEVFSVWEDPKENLLEGESILLVTTGKLCSNFNCALVKGESSRLSAEDCISSAPGGSVLRSGTFILLLVAAALAVIV